MNKLNIAATGYPGTTESWKFLHEMSADLAAIIGRMIHRDDPVIITGCNISGSNISDGYISYAGEIFRFIGGTKTDTVVLVEEVTDAEYYTDLANSGALPIYPTYIRRYAKCGNPGEGFTNVPLGDFVRLSEVVDIDERTKQSTENTAGIAEIATQAEANADTDDTRMITPKKLAGRTATETRKGVAEIATQAEVNAGTDDTRIVTPKKLKEELTIFKEIITLGRLSTSGNYSGSANQTTLLSGTVSLPGSYTDYFITGSVECEFTVGGGLIKNILWYTINRQSGQFDIFCEVQHSGLNTQDYSLELRLDYLVTKP